MKKELKDKLSSFSQDLPAQEQEVLDWLVSRAEAAELSNDELRTVNGGDGYLGFGGLAEAEDGVKVTIEWSKSF